MALTLLILIAAVLISFLMIQENNRLNQKKRVENYYKYKQSRKTDA